MNTILHTHRCILRPFELEDAVLFFEMNNDEEVLKYTGDVAFLDLNEARHFVKDYISNPENQYLKYGMGRLTIQIKESLEVIGWCGLKYRPSDKKVDVGYRILKKYWGKGYATEAAKRSLQHAFEDLNLKEVIANVHEENIGSQYVAERAGMHLDHRFLWDGRLPARYYKITSDVCNN